MTAGAAAAVLCNSPSNGKYFCYAKYATVCHEYYFSQTFQKITWFFFSLFWRTNTLGKIQENISVECFRGFSCCACKKLILLEEFTSCAASVISVFFSLHLSSWALCTVFRNQSTMRAWKCDFGECDQRHYTVNSGWLDDNLPLRASSQFTDPDADHSTLQLFTLCSNGFFPIRYKTSRYIC